MKLFSVRSFILSAFIMLAMCFGTGMYIYDESGATISVTLLEFYISDAQAENIYMIQDGLSGNWTSVLIPVIVSLPSLLLFADTEQSGYWRFQKIRSTNQRYCAKTFICTCASGAFATLLGFAIFTSLMLLKYPSPSSQSNLPPEDRVPIVLLTDNPLCRLVGKESIALFILLRFVVVLVFAFLIAAVCLNLFILLKNRYKAIGMPLIIIYLLNSISTALTMENKMSDARYSILSPSSVLKSCEVWFEKAFEISFWYMFLLMVIMIVVSYISFCALIKRRQNR